jgi:hypothetical protein
LLRLRLRRLLLKQLLVVGCPQGCGGLFVLLLAG